MRPRSDVLPPLLSLLSHGRRVVVVVLVEVAGTLLVGVLLPRGEVLSVGSLDLLAVFLEETEPALLTVTALWRGRGARVGGERGDVRATCARETGGCFETAARNNWTFLWLLSAGTCILVGSFMSSFFIS